MASSTRRLGKSPVVISPTISISSGDSSSAADWSGGSARFLLRSRGVSDLATSPGLARGARAIFGPGNSPKSTAAARGSVNDSEIDPDIAR